MVCTGRWNPHHGIRTIESDRWNPDSFDGRDSLDGRGSHDSYNGYNGYDSYNSYDSYKRLQLAHMKSTRWNLLDEISSKK